MRFAGLCLIALSVLLGNPANVYSNVIKPSGGDMPFPLGAKAPLPWESIDGYWSDYNGQKYFYRIEVLETYKDGSRTVSVALLDNQGVNIVATGLGFVRANSKDLWARAKGVNGANIDMKVRLQAFFPENSVDMDKRALVASLQDMTDGNSAVIKHMIIKVDSLEGRQSR